MSSAKVNSKQTDLFLAEPTTFNYMTVWATTHRWRVYFLDLVVQDWYSGRNVSQAVEVEERLLKLALDSCNRGWWPGGWW